MDKEKYINYLNPMCRIHSFATLIIGSMLLFTSNAFAGQGFTTGIEGLMIFFLYICGILTIIEIIIFIIHKSHRTKASRKLFIITSAIYIPIISILLGALLTSSFSNNDGMMLIYYLLSVSALYTLLIYSVSPNKVIRIIFIITSVIYIPIISIVLVELLTSLLSNDYVMILISYLLSNSVLYALLIYSIFKKKNKL